MIRSRKIIASSMLGFGMLASLVGCSSGSNDSSSTTIPQSPPTTAVQDLAGGAKVDLSWRVEDVIKVSDPQAEITAGCPVANLPTAGSSFFVVSVTLTNPTDRPLPLPETLMDVKDNKKALTDFASSKCVPKQLESIESRTELGEEYLVSLPPLKSAIGDMPMAESRWTPVTLEGGGSETLIGIVRVEPSETAGNVALKLGDKWVTLSPLLR